MRILLIPSVFVPSVGGVQLNTLKLAEHLSARGHSVTVLTSNWRQWRCPIVARIGKVWVVRLPFYVYRGTFKSLLAFVCCFPIAAVGTIGIFAFARPDVANVHFIGSNAFYALLGVVLFRVRTIVTLHGNEVISVEDSSAVGYTAVEAKIMRYVAKRLLQRAANIVAVSRHLLARACQEVPDIEAKCSVIYMPGQDVTIKEGSPSRPASDSYILAVGRLSKEKGFDLLLLAFAQVQARIPRDVNLVLAGDGPERQRLEKIAVASGCANRVVFAGWTNPCTLAQWYASCLFVVMPSRWEGLPSVAWEAFRHGKCVIGTSVGGIPEIVQNEKTGLLVQPEDSSSLAKAIELLVANPVQRAQLGRNAKLFGKEVGNWTKSTDAYLRIYQEATGT